MRGGRTVGEFRIFCNLGYDLAEPEVSAYFQALCAAGQVTDCYIPRHSSGRNKGFGFVTFEREADLLAVLQRPEHLINGNKVAINRAGPRPDPPQSQQSPTAGGLLDACREPGLLSPQRQGKGPRLYVGGVPDSLSEEEIRRHFRKYGNVCDLYFPGGKKGRKRVNYCFVAFDDWSAALAAVKASLETGCKVGSATVQTISIAEERKAPTAPSWPPVPQPSALTQLGLQQLAGAGSLSSHMSNSSLHSRLSGGSLQHVPTTAAQLEALNRLSPFDGANTASLLVTTLQPDTSAASSPLLSQSLSQSLWPSTSLPHLPALPQLPNNNGLLQPHLNGYLSASAGLPLDYGAPSLGQLPLSAWQTAAATGALDLPTPQTPLSSPGVSQHDMDALQSALMQLSSRSSAELASHRTLGFSEPIGW